MTTTAPKKSDHRMQSAIERSAPTPNKREYGHAATLRRAANAGSSDVTDAGSTEILDG